VATREPRFRGTITYTKRPVAGITLYQDTGRKDGASIEEMLDELEKSDILSARKELLLSKLRERGVIATKTDKKAELNPKRYLVDPDTGKITVDEEDGEYTYKDAALISVSIKGKGGHYDEAIDLLNAVKTFAKEGRAEVTEKPKEYYVEPDSGVIVHDPENGEHTLSEARAISQSMQKGTGPKDEPPLGFIIDNDGNLTPLKPGEPVVIKKTLQQPARTFFLNENNELVEQEAGKPIVIKIQQPGSGGPQMMPFPAMSRDGSPVVDKEGKPIYVDIEPQLRWLTFQNDQRRADGRHDALIGLVKTVRENLGDGVAALKAAAADIKGGPGTQTSEEPQTYECGQCHTQFRVPQGDFEKVTCPNPSCKFEYTKETLESA